MNKLLRLLVLGAWTLAPVAVRAENDANNGNLALFPWGDPQFTDGGMNTCPRPAWVLAACMDGGLWITNDASYGWQPGLGDWHPNLATNRLLIHLDRALVSNNLWLAVAGVGDPNATLLAGFYDNDLLSVADPLVLHVAATTPWSTNNINLSRLPSASVISLSATNGLLRIFSTVLSQDNATRQTTSAPVSVTTPGKAALGVTASTPATTASASSAKPPGNGPPDELPGNGPPDGVPGNGPPDSPPGLTKGPQTWYVDAATGDDVLRDGTSHAAVAATAAGPKRTIAAALATAAPGDTIFVAAGTYPERVKIDGIRLITNGRVELQ
ncbi:MAG: hypothetical protein WCI17_03335 [bacterium]